MHRRGGRRVAAVAAAVLAAGALTPGVAVADHGHGPSAAAVAAGKARVASLEQQVRTAAQDIQRAQDRLRLLDTRAEVAVETFNHARVVQEAAQHDVDAADAVLALATDRVHASRRAVGRFAVAAYEGGNLTGLDAVLSAAGPEAMFYRLGALDAVARSQRDVVEGLSAATAYQAAVATQKLRALHAAARAASVADAARRAAQAQVEQATVQTTTLERAKRHLAAVLRQARAHASALERARLAALARARAAAAARAERAREAAAAAAAAAQTSLPAPSPGGGSTVSAATEAAALRAAESQLGKPYQWGAAGPDSYDCSGLVMWAYAQVGEHIDHWTGDQWNEGQHIPLASLRAGDLLFFATDTSDPGTIHHVGMYVGNGEMIEAPYTGADVRYSGAFRPDLIGAVRLYVR